MTAGRGPMSVGWAVFWFFPGLVFGLIDAWLSMQSVFGLLRLVQPFDATLAIVVGVGLTAFAIGAPAIADLCWPPPRQGAGWRFAVTGWLVICAVDVVTSLLGAVWYWALRRPYTSAIHPTQITPAPGNWAETTLSVTVVIVAAVSCVQLGRALQTLVAQWWASGGTNPGRFRQWF